MCRSSGTRFLLDPTLTPWANVYRPFGAGLFADAGQQWGQSLLCQPASPSSGGLRLCLTRLLPNHLLDWVPNPRLPCSVWRSTQQLLNDGFDVNHGGVEKIDVGGTGIAQ